MKNDAPYPEKHLTYLGNVLNAKARAFYRRHGVETIEPAAESGVDLSGQGRHDDEALPAKRAGPVQGPWSKDPRRADDPGGRRRPPVSASLSVRSVRHGHIPGVKGERPNERSRGGTDDGPAGPGPGAQGHPARRQHRLAGRRRRGLHGRGGPVRRRGPAVRAKGHLLPLRQPSARWSSRAGRSRCTSWTRPRASRRSSPGFTRSSRPPAAARCYVFDCLSELAADWYSDQMLGNFFMLTCPYLYDLETVAYFALFRNSHSSRAIRPITETTQLFLDVYRHAGDLYVHPIKVQHRYSPTMNMLHVWEGDEFRPVTSSVLISDDPVLGELVGPRTPTRGRASGSGPSSRPSRSCDAAEAGRVSAGEAAGDVRPSQPHGHLARRRHAPAGVPLPDARGRPEHLETHDRHRA